MKRSQCSTSQLSVYDNHEPAAAKDKRFAGHNKMLRQDLMVEHEMGEKTSDALLTKYGHPLRCTVAEANRKSSGTKVADCGESPQVMLEATAA